MNMQSAIVLRREAVEANDSTLVNHVMAEGEYLAGGRWSDAATGPSSRLKSRALRIAVFEESTYQLASKCKAMDVFIGCSG
jgi:hypothetical protein